MSEPLILNTDLKGYCNACQTVHTLSSQAAYPACYQLMEKLEENNGIDFFHSNSAHDKRCATDYLFGDARGKMFGAMVGLDQSGKKHVRYAFSGQYNGLWQVPGWVEPLFPVRAFEHLTFPVERRIKELGKAIATTDPGTQQWQLLKRQRKELSRHLMEKIFNLYILVNFGGIQAPLKQVFLGDGIPTGTGACCAPKLLYHAALNSIIPLGIAEFYWGRENASGTKQHGRFYSPCAEKCEPILGFMLCGLEKR